MRSYIPDESHSAGSAYPSYPPSAPSTSFNSMHQNVRRYSTEDAHPSSQAGSSVSPYTERPRDPLHLHPLQHVHHESDSYEERDLGEIAAAHQAAQEQTWGPHTPLSEASASHGLYQEQQYPIDRHASMPVMPGSFEPTRYDGGIYIEPTPQYHGAPTHRAPSMLSANTLGGRSRQSLPAYASPASSAPNMFDINAVHHLPGSHGYPQDAYGRETRLQPGALVGDSLPGFPNWSQTWYGGHLSADGHAYTMVPPGSGQSGWESETLSHGRYGPPGPVSPQGPYPYNRTNTDDYVKEERIRMLEKEFGPESTRNWKGKARDNDMDAEEIPMGGVDAKGRLVLPRRRLRIATRWLQCLISMGAAGMGIGGFIVIHPERKAPPSGTFASFVLYGVSAISLVVCFWLFALKPCCRSGRESAAMEGDGAGNGMVIPIMTTGSGARSNHRRGLFGKKRKGSKGPQGPCVNLIVDPKLLGGRGDELESESDNDEGEIEPNEACRRQKRKTKRRKQRGILANMKLQAQWRVARKSLKWDCGWDVVLCLLWGAAAVMALIVGKRCPVGTGSGWCNLYNGAVACSVVATLLFLVAIYCDVVALRASRAPPAFR